MISGHVNLVRTCPDQTTKFPSSQGMIDRPTHLVNRDSNEGCTGVYDSEEQREDRPSLSSGPPQVTPGMDDKVSISQESTNDPPFTSKQSTGDGLFTLKRSTGDIPLSSTSQLTGDESSFASNTSIGDGPSVSTDGTHAENAAIHSPWDTQFQELTAHEQAMQKLYSKYGGECDERLSRASFGLCSRYLQNLCPACFGGTVFGKSEAQYVVPVTLDDRLTTYHLIGVVTSTLVSTEINITVMQSQVVIMPHSSIRISLFIKKMLTMQAIA
jgi:hypothetical protein